MFYLVSTSKAYLKKQMQTHKLVTFQVNCIKKALFTYSHTVHLITVHKFLQSTCHLQSEGSKMLRKHLLINIF